MTPSNRFPNLIIAGVHKAGTTSLFTYLSKHPQICASRIKEIGYFMPLRDGKPLPPVEQYLEHFNHCQHEAYRMEASPSYLYGGDAIAGSIQTLCPGVRIVVILRDPVERMGSFYHHIRSKALIENETALQDFVRASLDKAQSADQDYFARGVREGEYAHYLKPWLERFGDSLKIVYFDDLRENPRKLCDELTQWLELPSLPEQDALFTVENRTIYTRNRLMHIAALSVNNRLEGFLRNHHTLKRGLRRFYYALNARSSKTEGMDELSVQMLRAHYAPHNQELRDLLVLYGRNGLPSWLNTPHVRS